MNGPAADAVDALLQRPAVVVGSLPPAGRDLDLLVEDIDAATLPQALKAVGFIELDGVFVREGPLGRDEIDLVTADHLNVPPAELRWLREGAVHLLDYHRLRQPGAAATLLLLARRDLAPPLAGGHAARMASALADSDATDVAALHAPGWGVSAALAMLLGREGLLPRYRAAREHQARTGTPRLAVLRAVRRALRGRAR